VHPAVDVPVVVLGAQYGGLGVARTLGRWGVPAYGVHALRSAGLRSRYWRKTFVWDFARAPYRDSLRFLLETGSRIGGRPILLPTTDVAAALVDRAGDALAERYRFPRPAPGLVRTLLNKAELTAMAEAHGVPVPRMSAPQAREDAVAFLDTAALPVMMKAVDPTGPHGRTKIIAGSRAEALAHYDALAASGRPNLLLQEYIPGDDTTGWTFYGCFGDGGDCLAGFAARKIRLSPAATGVIALGITAEIEAVQEQCRRFMTAVGYRGVVNIGGKFDRRDGRYKVLDVNARLGGSFRLCVDTHGLDVVRVLYLHLTGQPVPVIRPVVDRKWMMEEDFFTFRTYVRRGDLSVSGWLRSLAGVRELAWWATDDPIPGLFWVADRIGRALGTRPT
jgi:D-aspartate ligase